MLLKERKTGAMVILAMLLLIFSSQNVLADGNRDFSSIVKIQDYELTVDDKPVEENGPVVVGSVVSFGISWKVYEEDFHNKYAEGDRFYINLPSAYFNFTPTSLDNELRYEGKLIARFGINDAGRIEVVLTKDGAEQLWLEGTFEVKGKLDSIDDSEESISIDIGGIEKEIPVERPNITPPEEDFPYTQEETDGEPFDKYAAYSGPGTKRIDWFVRLNRDIYYKQAIRESTTVQKNVVIEDELENGLTLKGYSLSALLSRPVDETGKPSTHQATSPVPLFSYNGVSSTNRLGSTEVKQITGETYEQFKSRVMNVSEVSHGVYENDGCFSLVISLGDLPGNGVTYEALFKEVYGNDSFKENLRASNSTLTEAEYDVLARVWGKENAIGGQITYYRLAVETEGSLGETYKNTARVTINDKKINSNETKVKTEFMAGTIVAGEPGSVRIYKKDAVSKENISAAKFKVQFLANGEWTDYIPTDGGEPVRAADSEGRIEFKKLLSGKYRVIEVEAAEGYELNSAVYDPSDEFEIKTSDAEGVAVIAYNRKAGSFTAVKVDEAEAKLTLQGAEFILFRMKDSGREYYTGSGWSEQESDAHILVSDESGKINVESLPQDTYYLMETAAPYGYELPAGEDAISEFTIAEEQLHVEQQITNKRAKGSIILTKVDEQDKTLLLENAVFVLYDAEGKLLDTYKTAKDGTIIVKNLPYGAYYFIEKTAPDGYQLPEGEKAKVPFEIQEGTLVNGFCHITVKNSAVTELQSESQSESETEKLKKASKKTDKKNKTPKTGDSTTVDLFVVISLLSAIIVFILTRKYRKV